MIKQTISYTDYNGVARTEDLYFHAPKHVLMDHLDLQDTLERISENLSGEKRELNHEEVNEILQLVKRFVRLSHGVRVDGGRRFVQNDEKWEEFQSSAVYDALLWSMFDKPEKAFAFMRGIMPEDLLQTAEAQNQLDASGPKRPMDFQRKHQERTQPTLGELQAIEFNDDDVEEHENPEDAIPNEVTGGYTIEELEAELARRKGDSSQS